MQLSDCILAVYAKQVNGMTVSDRVESGSMMLSSLHDVVNEMYQQMQQCEKEKESDKLSQHMVSIRFNVDKIIQHIQSTIPREISATGV